MTASKVCLLIRIFRFIGLERFSFRDFCGLAGLFIVLGWFGFLQGFRCAIR